MSLCTLFRQLLIYFISLAPLRAAYYLSQQVALPFKIISIIAFLLLVYTNTIYLLLCCKYNLNAFFSYLFVVGRFIYPLMFAVGLAWSPELIQYSSYYMLYYTLGLIYGVVVIGSLPCEGLISDQRIRQEYKEKTEGFLKLFICRMPRRRRSQLTPPLQIHITRHTNPDIVFMEYPTSRKNSGCVAKKAGATELLYQESTTTEACAICLQKYEFKESVACLKQCEHVFHKQCLMQWCKTGSNACPLCRTRYPLPLLFTRRA